MHGLHTILEMVPFSRTEQQFKTLNEKKLPQEF